MPGAPDADGMRSRSSCFVRSLNRVGVGWVPAPLLKVWARSLVALVWTVALVLVWSAAAAGVPEPAPLWQGPMATTQGPWEWPVETRKLVRAFEAPSSRYSSGHRGIDLVAESGQPVRSPAAGVVSFAGTVVDRPVLSIEHGDGIHSSFEPVRATVAEGDPVRAGQVVGVVATGAHCSGRCVHFGVRRNGQYVSPMIFLGGVPRAVLLPFAAASSAERTTRHVRTSRAVVADGRVRGVRPAQARGWASR